MAMVGFTNIVNRRMIWGMGAFSGAISVTVTSTSDVSNLILFVYGPFGYGVPAVATGATRYYRIYANWGDNMAQGNWYIDFVPQTSGSTITFTMPTTWGTPNVQRDGYSSNLVADPGSNFNFHGTINLRMNTTGKGASGSTLTSVQVQINSIELQAIDQY